MKISFYASQLLWQKLSFGLLVFGLFLWSAASTSAAPGDLDTSFGNGGKVITSGGGANAVAIQADGKIVVAGFSSDATNRGFALARYNSDGSLDTSFGTDGKVITPFGNNSGEVLALAIQADGKIVAAGFFQNGTNSDSALARYNTDGSLDASFGTGGKVTVALGNGDDRFWGVVIQTDGKIVAVGFGRQTNLDFVLARYNTNGSLDTGFGTGGVVFTNIGRTDAAHAAVIQTDGKIIVAGESEQPPRLFDFALARYNTNGSLDTTFGNGGTVVTSFHTSGSGYGAFAVAIQTDGKIVAAGDGRGASSDFALARYNTNGTLDTSFDKDGKVTTQMSSSGDIAYALAIQSNGKIVVAGEASNGANGDFALARYNTDGSLDNGFGANGKVFTPLLIRDSARAIAIQPDGKLIAAGFSTNAVIDGNASFALVRYNGDLQVRRTAFDFDGDGKADQAVFRSGIWYLLRSQAGFTGAQFGAASDKIVPADFDGDGKTDIAVFRDGFWYWLDSSNGSFNAAQFGQAGDVPVPADYSGDGRAELAVFRGGFWYTFNLTNNQFQGVQFGIASDKPVAADYDGDGKADIAVVRQANGLSSWYILGTSQGFYGLQFGNDTDKLVPADYDGDGKTDVAVFRGGFWYILRSTQGFYGVQFGAPTDIPVAADYDGDGKADVAVFRDGFWYMLRSQQGFGAVQFGQANDKPIPAAFVP